MVSNHQLVVSSCDAGGSFFLSNHHVFVVLLDLIIHRNERFFEEMYNAYLEGRSETDPTTFWYKGEIGFFDFYIIPLAKKLKDCGVFGVSSDEYLVSGISDFLPSRSVIEHKLNVRLFERTTRKPTEKSGKSKARKLCRSTSESTEKRKKNKKH
jgi:hypothetical protein